MMLIQEAATQAGHDPFLYGVGVSAVGAVMLLLRAIRGKAFSKIQGAIAIALIVLGAAISFGMLARVIEPVMRIVERFAG